MSWTESKWHCHSLQSILIPSPTGSEWQSPVCCSLIIIYHCITNRKWVAVPFFWQAVSSHVKQQVSVSALFLPGTLIKSCAMTDRKWVAVPYFCSLIISYDQQEVSDSAISLPGSLIPSHPMHDQQEVSDTTFCLSQVDSLHLIPWLTVCGWQCPYFFQQTHHVSLSHDI